MVSTIGIFLPSFILVLVAAPLLAKYRLNTNVQGVVKGAYAAAIGTILGAASCLGKSQSAIRHKTVLVPLLAIPS